jgi:hypothetical protein
MVSRIISNQVQAQATQSTINETASDRSIM